MNKKQMILRQASKLGQVEQGNRKLNMMAKQFAGRYRRSAPEPEKWQKQVGDARTSCND